MIVYALAAADRTPLTKTFSQTFGVITKSSYPNVRDFISHDAEVENITEFFAFICVQASVHNCLVKGRLNRPLNSESRQGATNSQDTTDWIVFDIDHLPGINDAEAFVALLPPEFHNASYVLQLSSSSGMDDQNELRAHLFFMLSQPIMAPTIKLWTKQLNLNQPVFAQHLRLAEGGCTLKWPVDISVNQNDKLIYIAPPICREMEDPVAFEDRIRLVPKEHGVVQLDVAAINAESIRNTELTKVNELRAAAGLERKKLRFEMIDGHTVIKNADQMTLTAPPFEERGFMYFPVGSNRHTYYHPLGDHEFLYSFKDPEIAYPMRIVLPQYFWDCERQTAAETRNGQTILAFRDGRSDVKYIGSYSDDLNFASFNRIRAREDIEDFYKQHHQRTPEIIPTWNYEFNPLRNTRIDPENNWLNKFIPSQFMDITPSGQTNMPFRIERLLKHIMNNDAECYHHFVNWLAFKFQTKTKCKTAWFFQGVEGTGKGVLYNKVLRPLFGADYCHLKRMDALLDRFNAELETSLIWVIDEANIEDFKDDGQIIEKLKNLIVEDQQVIRAMRTDPYNAVNYTDVILFSNRNLAIKISDTDRRYNICPRQNKPLLHVMTREEINDLERELPQMADFLLSMEVDENKAATPLENRAKRDLVSLSRNSHDDFIHHLLAGDLLFILRNVTEASDIASMRAVQNAKDVLVRWADEALTEKDAALSLDDINAVYSGVVSNKTQSTPVKMARMLMLRGAELRQENEEVPPLLPVTWTIDELAIQRWLNTQRPLSPRSPHGQQGRQTPN